MEKCTKQRLAALLLAVIMVLSATACGKKAEEPVAEDNETPGFMNALPVPDGPNWKPVELEKYSEMAQEKHALNADTVGWLQVPDTSLNDVIVWYPNDTNEYYARRDFQKRYYWEGSYYADFRCTFDGTRGGLAQNTVIYGHSMEDDPNGPLFSQLKKWLDEDFAKSHPYINFSTLEDDMTWEIFAIYYANSRNFIYNTPVPKSAADFEETINEARKRSIYNYDTELTADDKIITLSTCCYNIVSSYPNQYRYVVMAKLVDETKPLKEEAAFTKNPSPKEP